MNAITRFVSLGRQDADRRVASILAREPLDTADRYVEDSAVVAAVDRMTRRLPAWWMASTGARLVTFITEPIRRWTPSERNRTIGATVLTATAVHVALTIVNGSRPGWFWLVIPSMAAMFALVVLSASSRSNQ